MRKERILNELALLQENTNFKVEIRRQPKLVNYYDWVVWLPGRKNTPFQGAVYPIFVNFPEEYPLEPPKMSFKKDFQHMHVYEDGSICLPVIDWDFWKTNRTMSEILGRLDGFLHQKPNILSPANQKILNIYQQKEENYEQMMRDQAKLYDKSKVNLVGDFNIHVWIQHQNQ